MKVSNQTTQILMAIITIILILAALKATQPISMPLAFAFFIVVLVYPLQNKLEQKLPRWLSLMIVLLVLGGVVALAQGALSLSAEIIEPKIPQYLDRLEQMWETAQSWASNYGLPVPQFNFQNDNTPIQLTQQAITGFQTLVSTVSLLILTISLLILLLLEVSQYKRKVQQAFSSRMSQHIIHAVGNTSEKLRRYLTVMTFTCFLTGILTSIWCLIIGVDLALVWGLIAFVLNYVPTLGSIIAVIPPTLIAILFNGVPRGIATLIGLAVIQVTMGNFVDPRIQGKTLQLSPFIALFSIVFWGWIWGIAGAILGIPMTISIILFCEEFETTRGVAILLGEVE